MKKDNVWKIISEDLDIRKVCSKMMLNLLIEDLKD